MQLRLYLGLSWLGSVLYLGLLTGVNARAAGMGLSYLEIGALNAVAYLVYAIVAVTGGQLGDRFGFRAVLTVACGLAGLWTPLGLVADTPIRLGGLLSGIAVFFAVFWPALEGLLSQGAAAAGLTQGVTVSRFCLAWSSGNVVGTVLGPWLAVGWATPLWIGAAVVLWLVALGVGVDWRRHGRGGSWLGGTRVGDAGDVGVEAVGEFPVIDAPGSTTVRVGGGSPAALQDQRRQLLLRSSRAAMFIGAMALASAMIMLPKLASSVGIGLERVGWVGTGAPVAIFAVFIWFARWRGWEDRPWLALAPIAILFPVSGIVFSLSPRWPVLFLGMLLVGANYAMPYAQALHYALTTRSGHGQEGGWHEAVIGTAYIAGPVLTGAAMDRFEAGTGLPLILGMLALLSIGIQARFALALDRLADRQPSAGAAGRELPESDRG